MEPYATTPLERLVKRVVELHAGDPTAPSVIVSWLTDHRTWYVSVHRFDGRYGEGRQILQRLTDASLERALERMLELFPKGG